MNLRLKIEEAFGRKHRQSHYQKEISIERFSFACDQLKLIAHGRTAGRPWEKNDARDHIFFPYPRPSAPGMGYLLGPHPFENRSKPLKKLTEVIFLHLWTKKMKRLKEGKRKRSTNNGFNPKFIIHHS
jgi:hypothetical protein